MASFASLKSAIFDTEERKLQYQAHIRGLNAYDRHKKFLNDYVGFYGKEKSTHVKLPVKTNQDTLKDIKLAEGTALKSCTQVPAEKTVARKKGSKLHLRKLSSF